MRIQSTLIATLFCLFASGLLFGQSDDETALKDMIIKRHNLTNTAKSIPNKQELLNMHMADFVSIHSIYMPDGSVSRRERSLEDWKRILTNYSDAGDIQYATKVENIAYSHLFDKTAVVIYRVSYTMKDIWNDEVLYGGDQIITANFKKTPDGWKYRDIYVTELRNTINKYVCSYELYQKDANELLVSVKVPSGSEFRDEYIDVRFTESKPGLNMIVTDRGDNFAWENNELRQVQSNTSTDLIGRPNSKTGVCEDLIMFYNAGACSGTRQIK